MTLRHWLTSPPDNGERTGAAVLGSAYLVLVDFVEVWRGGAVRALHVVLFLILLAAGRLLRGRLEHAPRGVFLALGAVAVTEAVRSLPTPYHVHTIGSLLIACIVWSFAFANAARLRDTVAALSGPRIRWLCVTVLIVACLASAAVTPKMFDVATTTLSAIKALSGGTNPYHVDIDAFGRMITNDARFAGYKYTPLTALVYWPFVWLLGDRGILACNILVLLLTAMAVGALFRRLRVADAQWGAILLLASPLVGLQVLVYQVNDLLAVLPICLAFLVWDRRPGLAGLLLGASFSMKLLPAPLAMLLLMPPEWRAGRRFVAGIAIGLVPTAVFAALDPTAFFNNVVLFNMLRPIDPSSWLLHMPPLAGRGLKLSFAAISLATATVSVVRCWAVERRMLAYCVLIILLLLTSPIDADNYFLWWIPFFLALLCGGAESTPGGEGATPIRISSACTAGICPTS